MPLHLFPTYIDDVWTDPEGRGSVEYSVAALPNFTLEVKIRVLQARGARNFKFSFQVLFKSGNSKTPLSDRKRIFDSRNVTDITWSRYFSVYKCESCEEVKVEVHSET